MLKHPVTAALPPIGVNKGDNLWTNTIGKTSGEFNPKVTRAPIAAILWCICHFCHKPTFIDERRKQFPGSPIGRPVEFISDGSTSSLYEEARQAAGANAYTAAILACRKILMHIAVSKGAKENQDFVDYVKYLGDNHYFPPDAKEWVDQIRKRGNEANHEIVIMSKDEAEVLLGFVEMLLKVIFEYPALAKQKATPSTP